MTQRVVAISSAVLVLIIFAANSSTAQEHRLKKSEVPKAVLESFQKQYPTAKILGYSKEAEKGTTSYEVESIDGKIRRDVSFAADGSIGSVEESVSYAELPDLVRKAMTTHHAHAKVVSCERAINGTTTQYELVVTAPGEGKHELVFNQDGTLAESEKK
jgi:hypothetical protein